MKIGVFAPSLPSEGARREKIRVGLQELVRQGHELELGRSVWSVAGYKSASAKERAHDLERFLRDPTIDLVLATTGGYNSNEILGWIDLGALPRSRKVFVGYSDCTALSLAIESWGVCRTVCGPMVVDIESDPACFERLFATLKSGNVSLCNQKFCWEDSVSNSRSQDAPIALPGKAQKGSGVALAGNLSTFCLMLGTQFMPTCSGKVLFLEYDKEEARALPSLERYLWQIRFNQIFSEISGLVFGALQKGVAAEENSVDSLVRILSEVTEGYSFPVIYNAQFGHLYPSWSIPNGWNTLVDTSLCSNEGTKISIEMSVADES